MQGTRTAFVTGGSGFIGGALVRRLLVEGWSVRALARSDSSAATLRNLGAEPVQGDLEDADSIRDGAAGCDIAFHAAAAVLEWGSRDEFVRGNVTGTENALRGAREAGVRVRAANDDGFETVVIRPRLVWGPGDTTILPGLVTAVEKGRFAWIGGGRHLTDTSHVDNVIEGLLLGAERGRSGEAYFVHDGEPVEFRRFVTDLLATRGVTPGERDTPPIVARLAAPALEGIWKLLRRDSTPPVTRLALWLASQECTIDISKARKELGYQPIKTREQGLAELREVV